MVLEHDWKLIEDKQKATIERIKSGIDLINNGYDCIRYRHRKDQVIHIFHSNIKEENWIITIKRLNVHHLTY